MLLKDYRVEEKQSFKRLSVYISTKWVGAAWSETSKKEDMISWSFTKCGITLVLDGSENADLNIEGLLENYWNTICMGSIRVLVLKRAMQLRRGTRKYFISFEVWKVRCFDAKKLLYFGSSKNSIPLLSPPEYTPTKKDLSPDICSEFYGICFLALSKKL